MGRDFEKKVGENMTSCPVGSGLSSLDSLEKKLFSLQVCQNQKFVFEDVEGKKCNNITAEQASLISLLTLVYFEKKKVGKSVFSEQKSRKKLCRIQQLPNNTVKTHQISIF